MSDWTDSERAFAMSRCRGGWTAAEIGNAIGKTRSAVIGFLARQPRHKDMVSRHDAPKYSDGFVHPLIDPDRDAQLVARCRAAGGCPRVEVIAGRTYWLCASGRPWRRSAARRAA